MHLACLFVALVAEDQHSELGLLLLELPTPGIDLHVALQLKSLVESYDTPFYLPPVFHLRQLLSCLTA